MEKIRAKQVEGAVDTTSEQIIDGQKTFTAPVIISNHQQAFQMVSYDGFIYWAVDTNRLDEEGNTRMGMDRGSLVMQIFSDGAWTSF